MLATSCTFSGIVCNGLREQIYETKRSYFETNPAVKVHTSTPQKKTFIKRFNSFIKKKTLGVNKNCDIQKKLQKENLSQVKLLQQFWSQEVKTKTLLESPAIKNKNSTEQNNAFYADINSTPLNLKGRLPFEDFNRHKNADFVRRTKRKSIISFCLSMQHSNITHFKVINISLKEQNICGQKTTQSRVKFFNSTTKCQSKATVV